MFGVHNITLKCVSKLWKLSLTLENINTGVTLEAQSKAKHLASQSLESNVVKTYINLP